MNELLEQFLSEARDALEGIADKLMALESAPADTELMTQLFRLVHTLKGNSGLFEFPEMTRVLHAGEDLMDAVRNGRVAYSQALADRLLDAMDFVGLLCDDIEAGKTGASEHADDAVRLALALRALMHQAGSEAQAVDEAGQDGPAPASDGPGPHLLALDAQRIARWPEAVRLQAFAHLASGQPLWWLHYRPDEECFFQGDDPLHRALQTPGVLWGAMAPRGPWPALAELDAFRCVLDFELLSTAPQAELVDHYRYVPDQRCLHPVPQWALVQPQGDPNGGPVYDDFIADAHGWLQAGDLASLARAVRALLDLSSPTLWLASALRWLQAVLAVEPVNTVALRALVDSLRSLSAPDWSQVLATAVEAPATASAATLAQAALAAPSAAATHVPLPAPDSPAMVALANLIETQREVLALPDDAQWLNGRIKAAARVLDGCLHATGREALRTQLAEAAAAALAGHRAAPLAAWLEDQFPEGQPLTVLVQADAGAPAGQAASPERFDAPPAGAVVTAAPAGQGESAQSATPTWAAEGDTAVLAPERPAQPAARSTPSPLPDAADGGEPPEADTRFGRRNDEAPASARSLKVDQVKIDRLMNLIGEMVVAKNAIPYLANRAEDVFGVRELSREIKAQYAVINRISEEMQDAIMQVRMMPVSFIFQRFPRLVRDTSRRLGKEVNLVLEGQDTAADKNIIESLGDPLVHIVRNSLDHGLELPEVRQAAGKPAVGTLRIVARQASDRVVIEISDDGKGIDPAVIKHKAWQKGLIDEATLERLSDQEAINLVFAPGFSTAEVVSDLSGRGVGMDVVRTAVERVHGNISLESVPGQGTRIRLSLPLSMAVTNVMTIEADGQVFGVPMDMVVETVRMPASAVRQIKQARVATLRGRIVPLKALNQLLGLAAPPLTNDSDEYAVLVVRVGDETIGLLVDNFRETADIILKPLAGVLGGLSAYAGSALMGDGSVLMVLNVKEMV